MNEKTITIETVVDAPIERVWECWTEPDHIRGWAFASDDWEVPEAENDLREGGTFRTYMAAKDGSEGFDFSGVYTDVRRHELIEYDMDDGRHVRVEFYDTPNEVHIIQMFEPEEEHSEEMQRAGWQAILDNFKGYAEDSGD